MFVPNNFYPNYDDFHPNCIEEILIEKYGKECLEFKQRSDYICPVCHFTGLFEEHLSFKNNLQINIECASCKIKIRYTVKTEAVE